MVKEINIPILFLLPMLKTTRLKNKSIKKKCHGDNATIVFLIIY